jgi:peptide/nickel transport system substrate-binding protein
MKPFDDVRVRRAMNHAVDRRRLAAVLAADAVDTQGIVPESMPWSNPGRPVHSHDPARARALLREAGIPDGYRIQLWYIRDRGIDGRVVQALQQDLRNVGIEAELKPTAFAAFNDKMMTRRQIACGLAGWYQDYPDPSTFLDTLLNGGKITDESCNNAAFYNNPEVNRRLDEAGRIIDADRRLQLFREAEDLVIRDAPWVPLFSEQLNVISHPRLRGDVPHPVWGWRYENMWLSE